MKFAVFALIVGLCLVAVSANGGASVEPAEFSEFEFMPQDVANEVVDPEIFGVFGPLYFTLKAALRTIKGLNCTIQGVINMRNAAQKFLADIQSCGTQVTKQVQAVINSCNAVISTCNDIINLNDNVCNNGADNQVANANTKTPGNCFWKLLGKMLTLKKQISKTITLIKKVPTVGPQHNACAGTALNDLSTTFTTFPTFVKQCSKLTS